MDKIDRKILAELQADGRLSVTELADKVGLSVSPCHRRVRALEESGAITGYHAQLNPCELGLTFSARGLKSNGTKTYAKTIHPVPMGVSVAGVALS